MAFQQLHKLAPKQAQLISRKGWLLSK